MGNGINALMIISYILVGIIIIVTILVVLSKKRKKRLSEELNSLEREKNLIISAQILAELNKVESLINNDQLREKFNNWQDRFKKIKDVEVPKITDKLLHLEELFHNHEYEELKDGITDAELEITYLKTKTNFLLDEIKEITLSEERNREAIIKLKTEYREIQNKYKSNKNDYTEVSKPLELQFENVDKLFATFEMAMDQNAYAEVGKIVKAIGSSVGNLKEIIEEAPAIVMLGKSAIPNKIEDIVAIADKLTKEGYNIDYLNIDHNVRETNKKISDIFQRLNVLNIEDSVFELKTMLDYYESLYFDFDKERTSKKLFEGYLRSILLKLTKLEKINNDIYRRLDDIKYSYDLDDSDGKVIEDIKNELIDERTSYDRIVSMHRNRTFAYSRLNKEMEIINSKLIKTEEKLEITLKTLSSLKDDELRARDQLDEIKEILSQAKYKAKTFKLPVVPKNYYIELSEASMAINEMVKELEKRPISIKILNMRVDTARDLVLKVYNTINETIKTAQMAEQAIVYGNRYRPVNKDVEFGLSKAEGLFLKGNFKNSLEQAIMSINIVEPGILDKLMNEYK
ncbi:MAG: septation ring formation regulator EzrA [Bacilli bacterium]|nr:septation ring formation regulator EzrA [Bacilli bacterium]